MKLELISFKICPFVQRAVLTLLRKGMPYTITYIDMAAPPDWFRQISPFGKVPVLRVDDEHAIFESAVIDEFLDEISPGSLLPSDPLQRAIDRSWIDFGSSLILDFSQLVRAGDADTFRSKCELVRQKLQRLETKLGAGPWFNEGEFSLVDIAYAPLFMRTDMLALEELLYPASQYPGVAAWAKQLLAIPELPKSVVENIGDLIKGMIKKKAPYVAGQLGLA